VAAAGTRRRGRRAVPGARSLADCLSFDCQNFANHGGGNFKLSGAGAFNKVAVQRFGIRGRGSLLVTEGGRGRLIVESVCDRWMVKAVAA
jgi:hypothetical protein